MSIKALSDYTIYAKYARYDKEKQRRETWEEQVNRVFDMHERKFADQLSKSEKFQEEFAFAKMQVLKKRVLGSQRSLQFGGKPIEKHNAKMFNCSFGYIDRPVAFQEMMYLLLCGVGVGFSVQQKHVTKLPKLHTTPLSEKEVKKFVIPDSIEGWADAIGILVNSYFKGGKLFKEYNNTNVEFDYSLIRPAGSLIDGGFKAPGPDGLKKSIGNIRSLIEDCVKSYNGVLRSIDAYDIVMHMSDAVLSGGVRRSATICLFSVDDDLMMGAKTGSWFNENPQRGRSNNSAVLVRDETTREQFAKLMKSTREFGEPGFVWSDDEDIGYNPCVEIGLYPQTTDGRSGFQFCNLTEINGKWCKDEESFLQACRASAIIGTLQAGYTDFKYVSPETKEITDYEALLGCSITGMMDNPDIIFDDAIQKKGAKEIKKVNKIVAGYLGINQAARTCCVKPAGTTSCVLGTASGIHPHHARMYMRRVQANKLEFPVQHFMAKNPLAVEESVWSNNGTDMVISFLCEVPGGAKVKNQLAAVDLLEKVKLTQQNWVEYGTNKERCIKPYIRHNVSNTVTVKDDEWEEVEKFIYDNRKWFAGISLLSASGDKDYPQAPFTTVHTSLELSKMYGEASHFASGLIVDGLHAFNDNLWAACDCASGIGEVLADEIKTPSQPERPKKNGYTDQEYSKKLVAYAKKLEKYYTAQEEYDNWWAKTDWVRRVNKFANNHFEGDLKQATYCLKDVSNLHLWDKLKKSYTEIDWSEVVEADEFYEEVDTMGAAACAGGACAVSF